MDPVPLTDLGCTVGLAGAVLLDTIGINVPAEAVTLALAGGGLVQFAVMHSGLVAAVDG